MMNRLVIARLVSSVLELMDRKEQKVLDIGNFHISDITAQDNEWKTIQVTFSYKGKKNEKDHPVKLIVDNTSTSE